MKKTPRFSKTTNRVIIALMLFSCLNSAVVAAWADRDDWRRHARESHEWRHRHWHHHERTVYDDDEPYVTTFAPPVVVEPPPPDYIPSPGVNIVVPLNIR